MPLLNIGGAATPLQQYPQGDTAASIINDALVELGQLTTDLADPFDSTNQNVILACRLLKNLGRQLWREHNWSQLTLEHDFTTVDGQGYYALPADFGRLVDGTAWDRTNQLPMGGPLSPQEWQELKGRQATTTHRLMLRQYQGQTWLATDTDTPADHEIFYEYISRYWVQETGNSIPNTDEPGDGTDIIWFDPHLVKLGLKLRWLEAKGFDSSAAMREFTSALAQIKGDDYAAPTLSLSVSGGEKLLGQDNLPDTGYGS